MLILFIISGLLILVLKKPDLVPVIIFCQVSAVAVICYRSGLDIPLLALVVATKALIIPLLLYYIVRKTTVFVQKPPVIPASVVFALVLLLFAAAYLFTRHLQAGPFTMASIFTAFIGILCIITRQTLVGQVAGFIVLQNGIFAFTSSFCLKFTFVMELMLAIDVILAVLMMVYAIQTIYKNLGNIDIKTFTTLRG
jgi:hydrogenase-4 component E